MRVLQFGDHRVFLDLGNDRKSVTDLMTAPQLDAELLKSVLVKHDSGVDLLLAPTSPEEADLVNPENFAGVLAMLRTMYDYVIVDVDKRLGDLVLSILDHADEVHIVMTADLSCLKNVRLVLEALRRIGFDPKRLKLVLNRSNAFTGISVGAAESALKREFETKITNEYRIGDLGPEHGLAVLALEARLAARQGDRRRWPTRSTRRSRRRWRRRRAPAPGRLAREPSGPADPARHPRPARSRR